jgi:hypothetical protein
MERAGKRAEEGGPWLPGFRCYGVFVGSDSYVWHMLGQVVARIYDKVDKVTHLLRADSHLPLT